MDDVSARAAQIMREKVRANDPPMFSDDDLALAFSARHDGKALYVPAWGSWLVWEGGRWRRDETISVYDLARQMCRDAAQAAKDKDAAQIKSAGTVSAVERLARSDPRHARRPDDFDADPWALNTPAGVVDLQTGKMRAHRADDLHTKITGTSPGRGCPRWLKFLDEITHSDEAVIGYLQRWIGYTLTGIIREHAFMFTWGPGGNGKSVLLSTVAAILGDYATTAMSDVFTVTRNEQHPTHVASLRGARMVTVTETEEGRAWAEARIKSLTGGDKISARVMRGDLFEFSPQFKLWIAGNHRPVLNNPDPAMRRRLHLLPLTFVPPKPDHSLPEGLKAELPGILGWAIDGCLAWQREKLGQPSIVAAAVADYFAEQDSLALWFSERCERKPFVKTAVRAAFQDWQQYATARGEAPGSEKRFADGMQRHAVKKKEPAGMMFQDVRLLPPEPM